MVMTFAAKLRTTETLRGSAAQVERDAGLREGLTTVEQERMST